MDQETRSPLIRFRQRPLAAGLEHGDGFRTTIYDNSYDNYGEGATYPPSALREL